jgi:penicillin-binding protein 2
MLNLFFRKKNKIRGIEIEDSIMTITEKEDAIIETPFERIGLRFAWIFLSIFLFMLLGRVFYLSILNGDYYSSRSKNNRVRSISIKAPRGKILDKFGNILVGNVPSMDAVIIPTDLPDNLDERQKIAESVANVLSVDKNNVEIALESQNKKSSDWVILKENITHDQALILTEKASELPGIGVENTAIRNYENGPIFSHIIGYDGKVTRSELENNSEYLLTDYIGKAGLEKYYEKYLHGKNGARETEVDSMGRNKKNLGVIEPKSGSDLFLNIDEELQKKFYDSLVANLEKMGTKTAAAVAIDPRNGGVLAMVSFPTYDNNLFAKGISNSEYQNLIQDKNLPLLNRAINGEYPPGSTLKPAVAAAALTEGTITSTTIIQGMGGSINIGSFRFGDWKTHGPSDVRTAIAESNDVFFYSIGGGYGSIPGLGMDRMKKYENMFGLGNQTKIDLLNESVGLIPSEQWKLDNVGERWYIGDSYHCAIGQGFILTTPLQVANYTAAIANGGTLYQPRLVNNIKKSDGTIENVPPVVLNSNFIPKDVMTVVREGMRKTVTDGTAQPLKDLPVAVAGKTGTAQYGSEDKTHGWFIAFAPYDNPEIAIAIIAEGGGEGHSTGVPVTKDVFEWYFTRNK